MKITSYYLTVGFSYHSSLSEGCLCWWFDLLLEWLGSADHYRHYLLSINEVAVELFLFDSCEGSILLHAWRSNWIQAWCSKNVLTVSCLLLYLLWYNIRNNKKKSLISYLPYCTSHTFVVLLVQYVGHCTSAWYEHKGLLIVNQLDVQLKQVQYHHQWQFRSGQEEEEGVLVMLWLKVDY